MIEKMLSKEEKKLFSRQNINKIKKHDFAEYIAMYEAQLESLKQGYSPEVYKNPIVENIINELAALIDELNEYYYAEVLPCADKTQQFDEIDAEFDKTYEETIRPIEKEITRELKALKRRDFKY